MQSFEILFVRVDEVASGASSRACPLVSPPEIASASVHPRDLYAAPFGHLSSP
jgi:hypothetical protein